MFTQVLPLFRTLSQAFHFKWLWVVIQSLLLWFSLGLNKIRVLHHSLWYTLNETANWSYRENLLMIEVDTKWYPSFSRLTWFSRSQPLVVKSVLFGIGFYSLLCSLWLLIRFGLTFGSQFKWLLQLLVPLQSFGLCGFGFVICVLEIVNMVLYTLEGSFSGDLVMYLVSKSYQIQITLCFHI